METAPNSAPRLTDKQRAWIDYYVIHKNATKAAELAGYDSDDYSTLQSIGSENLSKPVIRAELDRRFRERTMTADEVVGRMVAAARFDLGEFLDGEGEIDLVKLKAAGLGHLVRESIPTREGRKITLADPDAALKLVARHLGLLADRLDVTLQDKSGPTIDELASIRQQLDALQQASDSGVGGEENDA